jgi:hypothetical protein
MAIILDGILGETFPSWTTATRPVAPAPGQVGYNSSLGGLETYNGTAWITTSYSLAVPSNTGNVLFTENGTSWSSTPKITSGTAFNPMSGTNLTFSSIPSWVKRITIMVNNSNSSFSFRVGTSGGIVTTGYTSVQAGVLASNQTSRGGSSAEFQGANTIGTWTLHNIAGNTWMYSGIGDGENRNTLTYGSISLAGVLTQLQIVGTFTSGVANIFYE